MKEYKDPDFWQYCDICKTKHFPIEWYRKWLLEYGHLYKEHPYGKKKKMTKQSEQILRWRAIVERHGIHVGPS